MATRRPIDNEAGNPPAERATREDFEANRAQLEEFLGGNIVPRCETCFYFSPVADDDAQAAGLPKGAGQCRAEPPGIGTQQTTHPITQQKVVMLVAVYPPTPAGSRCRHWQRDARTPLDHVSEQLERLVETLRSPIPPGSSGLA